VSEQRIVIEKPKVIARERLADNATIESEHWGRENHSFE